MRRIKKDRELARHERKISESQNASSNMMPIFDSTTKSNSVGSSMSFGEYGDGDSSNSGGGETVKDLSRTNSKKKREKKRGRSSDTDHDIPEDMNLDIADLLDLRDSVF